MAYSKNSFSRASFWVRLGSSGFSFGWAAWLFGKMGTHMGSWSFFHAQIQHQHVAMGEQVLAWIMLFLGVVAWLPGRWARIAALAGIFAALDAFAGMLVGGYGFFKWTPAAHALRILCPLVLLLWLPHVNGSLLRFNLGAVILRFGIAVVFATHGLEAILANAKFTDFIIGSADQWLGLLLDEVQVYPVLLMIGIVDLGVAVSIFFGSWRPLLAWIALWGVITALARMTTYGLTAYPEFFLRFPHFCAPLALWAYCHSNDRESASVRKTA